MCIDVPANKYEKSVMVKEMLAGHVTSDFIVEITMHLSLIGDTAFETGVTAVH